MLPTRERPRAKGVKKKRGKTSEGRSRDGLWKTLCRVRHATPRATARVLTAESPSSRARHPHAQRPGRERECDDRDRTGDPEAERQRLGVPARDDQAPDALEQVRDRVRGREVAEPGLLDQVPRDVHRRDEEKDEERGKEALHGLARAGP